MKIIIVEIKSCNGIPIELLTFLGKISKTNVKHILVLQTHDSKLNLVIYNKIKEFLNFYKIENIFLSKDMLNSIFTEMIFNNSNLLFSQKVSEENICINNLEKYILEYESYFGNLPYYLEDKKYIDKFMFINDFILQFGSDIVLH